ncbi:uncharacterized protein LOC113337937 [Papaver somniferum]|uniref:uncharacterized protein LOC113337937 n=1 Tax=Papaver somniferum TaxID=3469 RepID=UPI000E701E99|nr:uncharacterized protein LOC113337937 [Papaver somniferum]
MKASKYTLSEATLEKIAESSYGQMFLMFWHTKYSESHWEKLEAAVKKYLKCYKRGRVKNELTFEFVRRGETHIITSTPEKMGVMFGMLRMAGRRTDDTFLMVGGGWRQKPFYIRHFGDSNTVTRPMLQDAILKLLKRTGIKNCKSEGGEDSDDDNDEQVTDNAHKLKEKYFGLVDDLEKSKNVSWPDLIHSFLEKKINQNYNTPEDITGCVVYLLLLYAEHTHLVKPVTLPDDRYLPRAARWNIKEISVEFLKDMEASQYTFSKEFKDEYTIAYPPPQPNSGEEESSSSSEEGHDDLDDTVPSATTLLGNRG